MAYTPHKRKDTTDALQNNMTVTEGIQLYTEANPDVTGIYNGNIIKFTKLSNPNARIVRGVEFPLALNLTFTDLNGNPLSTEDASVYDSISQFVYDLSSKHDYFKKLIRKHATLAIKGFGSQNPDFFASFVGQFANGSELIEYEQNGIAHPRQNIAKNVTTVNKSTGFKRLYAHQEFSRFKQYPSILSFFAKSPSETGGNETLTHGGELYDVLKEKYPEFIEKTLEKGIYLTQTWPYQQDLGNNVFYSWKATHSFGKLIKEGDDLETQKEKAGKVCKEFVVDDYEWTPDNGLKLHEHTQPLRIHPYTLKPVLFSSLPTYHQKYKYALNTSEHPDTLEPPITYDDGEQIPIEYLDFLLDQSIDLCYEHKFEPGDIVFVDNYQAYHGRTAYGTQNREILASFWDDIKANKKDPAILVL